MATKCDTKVLGNQHLVLQTNKVRGMGVKTLSQSLRETALNLSELGYEYCHGVATVSHQILGFEAFLKLHFPIKNTGKWI